MSNTPLHAVVFDMDGLLLDTERIAVACWQEAARQLRLDFPSELLIRMVGMHTRKIPGFLLEELGADYPADAIAKRCSQLYQASTENGVPLKHGVLEILDFLEAHNLRKAVATSSRRENATRHLTHVNILSRFEFIVSGDDIVHPKPAPDIYQLALKKLDIPPANALALEDSDFGIRAALSAGLNAIMIPDLKPPSPEIQALGHPIVTDLPAAMALITKWLP